MGAGCGEQEAQGGQGLSRRLGEETKEKAIKDSSTRAAAEGLGWVRPGAEGTRLYRDSVLATETSSGSKS